MRSQLLRRHQVWVEAHPHCRRGQSMVASSRETVDMAEEKIVGAGSGNRKKGNDGQDEVSEKTVVGAGSGNIDGAEEPTIIPAGAGNEPDSHGGQG